MSSTVSDLIDQLNHQYNLRCDEVSLTQQFPGAVNIELAFARLLMMPMGSWATNTNVISRMVENGQLEVDTLLEIYTAKNISEPGTVSLLKPSSTAKLVLTDGYCSMNAILMKGLNMDLRSNIGKKILVRVARNSIKYGVLLLRNYEILNPVEQMEEELVEDIDIEQEESASNI